MDFGNDEGNTEKSRNTDILQNSVCMSSFTLAFVKCRPLVAFSQGKACYATRPELPHQRLISPVSYHNRMAQPRVPRCRCIPGGTTFKQANGRGDNPKNSFPWTCIPSIHLHAWAHLADIRSQLKAGFPIERLTVL